MKITLSTLRLAALPAVAFLSVSCGSKDEVASTANPYANNPYYGTEGNYGNYGATDQASVTPAPAQDYVAPAPAPSYSAPAPAASAPSYASNATGSRNHTVSKGDTLYSLSRQYGTTVNGIKSANGLSSDLITIGQNLAIP